MDSRWAAEQLEVIRTLMERTVLYRRALAPTSLLAGTVGLMAAGVGWQLDIHQPRAFGLYWMAVAVAALGAGLLIMRRQALRDAEPFWSPPARRVAQAVMPAFLAGVVAGFLVAWPRWRDELDVWWLPSIWMMAYGCGLHAAGFFMPRGIRLFGWMFVLLGAGASVFLLSRGYGAGLPALRNAHLCMGAAFGGLHLLYGGWLLFTRPDPPAA